jgi:hypothetical protein
MSSSDNGHLVAILGNEKAVYIFNTSPDRQYLRRNSPYAHLYGPFESHGAALRAIAQSTYTSYPRIF